MFSLVLPAVHRLGAQRELSEEERNQAALLYVGCGALLTGRSVLMRHRVRAASDPAVRPADRVHTLVGWQRQRSSHDFVMVERTWRFPRSIRVRDGLPEAPMARAAMDACRRCSSQDAVTAILTEVVQSGLATVDQLQRELAEGQRRGSRFPRLALEAIADGVRSVPEGHLREAALARGLHSLRYNQYLYLPDGRFIARPDAYDPATGTAVEVDSQEFHYRAADWKATMERHAWMTSCGLAVLHFPPSRLVDDVDGCLDQIALTIASRAHVPAPNLIMRDTALRLE